MLRSKEADATTCVIIMCRQRPLCLSPTIKAGRKNLRVWVKPNDTVRALKVAIQNQLNRNSFLNHQLLDPARQILYDPKEGYELQDQMPHGFANGQSVKLSLKELALPPLGGTPPWDKAFVRAKALTAPTEYHPDRPIRNVDLETSVFRTGGSPDLATSFAARETAMLGESVEAEIQALGVPESEWNHVDFVSERSVYTKANAAAGGLHLARASAKRFR